MALRQVLEVRRLPCPLPNKRSFIIAWSQRCRKRVVFEIEPEFDELSAFILAG